MEPPPPDVAETFVEVPEEPPGPAQVSVNVFVGAVRAPVLADPDVGLLPVHAPLAIQEVASVDDQLRVLEALLGTLDGLADKLTVGFGVTACTVTVAERDTLPPGPEHVSVYVRLLDNAFVD
jgi:hypothetical protein